MTHATADLCDSHADELAILPPGLRSFGARTRFSGPCATVRAPDDNSQVKLALSESGQGRVLVVEGGAGHACALVGGNLAALAAANGWAGLVIWGWVRDVAELARADLGILALGTCPRPSIKADRGERDVPLLLGGAVVDPGDWLYADEDGVVLADHELVAS